MIHLQNDTALINRRWMRAGDGMALCWLKSLKAYGRYLLTPEDSRLYSDNWQGLTSYSRLERLKDVGKLLFWFAVAFGATYIVANTCC